MRRINHNFGWIIKKSFFCWHKRQDFLFSPLRRGWPPDAAATWAILLPVSLGVIDSSPTWRFACSNSPKFTQKFKFFCVKCTLFQIFIFCPKIQLWFPEKIGDFFGVIYSWKCCGFKLFSCWQLWFHEKNCV